MTTLTIGRLATEVPDTEDAPERVSRLARLVADRSLEAWASSFTELSGQWCVRRLELELPWRLDEPDSVAAEHWAGLIAGAIAGLRPDGTNVLHYRSRSQALSELVSAVVLGDPSRSWAWRQAGLLLPGDPDPAEDPAGAAVTALRRQPLLVAAVLASTVRRAGMRRLHALLGEPGWVALATSNQVDLSVALRPPATGTEIPKNPSTSGPGRGTTPGARTVGTATDQRSTVPSPASPYPGEHRSGAEAERARSVLAASALAAALPGSGVSPSRMLLAAWAALVVAEVEPDRPTLAGAVAAELAAVLRTSERTSLQGDETPGPGRWHSETSQSGARTPIGSRPTAEATKPAEPRPATQGPEPHSGVVGREPASGVVSNDIEPFAEDPGAFDEEAESGHPTSWAGLPFLLNTAAEAGLPEALEDDPRLAGRSLRWSLHQLAQQLVPVRADDPAALALAGLTPTADPPPGPEPDDAEQAALAVHRERWATATRQRLTRSRRPEEDPVPTLWTLARRPGRIVADPGWIEVRLGLDDVDLLVRRAGVDLDPGWLSWLGTVVVFRYG